MLPAWMISDIRKKNDDEVVQHIGDEDTTPYRVPIDTDSGDCGSDDSDVLNCGSGGGSPPPPAPPDYQAEARAQMQLEDHRAELARQAQEVADKKAADKLEADKTAFQSRLGGAYATAKDYGSGKLRAMGIDDTYGIMSAYENALNRAKANVPELDPTPGTYLGTDIWDTTTGDIRTGQRNKLTRGYEAEVPQGFETTYIPDTADDDLINSIINEQFGEATEYVDRAKARGTLNETGYGTASRGLSQAKSGAIARANELGLGVLETGRTSLKDIDKQARSGLTNWDFGDTWDTDAWGGKIKTGAETFKGGLEGKLRNAFGGTEFFDPEAFIAKGGKAQGATNAGATALQDAISEEEKRRTAGSVGAF